MTKAIEKKAKPLPTRAWVDGEKILCVRTPVIKRRPVHPVMVGVFRWLRANAVAALVDPTVPWNGVLQDFDWLKDGVHHDPCPGRIITPDDPEGFDVELLKGPWKGMSLAERSISNLETWVKVVDREAWFDMGEVLRVTPTRELYAELSIKRLDWTSERLEIEDRLYREQQKARGLPVV